MTNFFCTCVNFGPEWWKKHFFWKMDFGHLMWVDIKWFHSGLHLLMLSTVHKGWRSEVVPTSQNFLQKLTKLTFFAFSSVANFVQKFLSDRKNFYQETNFKYSLKTYFSLREIQWLLKKLKKFEFFTHFSKILDFPRVLETFWAILECFGNVWNMCYKKGFVMGNHDFLREKGGKWYSSPWWTF